MLSDKLKNLFNILGAENKEIAELAGLDPSGISRLKSGKRTLKPSSKTIKKLVSGIYLFADDNNKLKLLARVTGCSPDISADEMNPFFSA